MAHTLGKINNFRVVFSTHQVSLPFVRFALTTLLRAFSVRLEMFFRKYIRKLVCITSLTQNHILFIIGVVRNL